MSAPYDLCSHGLTDECVLDVKTIQQDFKLRRQTATYLYYCPQHERHGVFMVKTEIPEHIKA